MNWKFNNIEIFAAEFFEQLEDIVAEFVAFELVHRLFMPPTSTKLSDSVVFLIFCLVLQEGYGGQVCSACTGVEDPGTCQHNITCNDNEKCFLHQYITETELKLSDLGCSLSQACPQYSAQTIVGKRSVGHHVVCWLCCDGTRLCNQNLTCEAPAFPFDCSDAVVSGASGVYVIYPYFTKNKPVSVFCYVENGNKAWTVFQRRINGSVDFYRNWTSYKVGFGQAGGEYWLGNENIHQLASHGKYELKVLLTDFGNVHKYAQYTTFNVSDESHKYKLTVTGYSGDAGDSLSRHNGHTFETFDSSGHDAVCARMYYGAWWYSYCHDSNLNGLYLPANNHTYGIGIQWNSWHGYTTSLKSTIMMMRRQ